jgi:hypothetical protein
VVEGVPRFCLIRRAVNSSVDVERIMSGVLKMR